MKFSLWTSNSRPWAEILDLATYADSSGWHSMWFADHFMSQTADNTPGTDDALECWTVLAALAVAVPRLRLTSMVSPVTIHHPVVLAKRVATVDQISGGRAVLGLGAGWQINEHNAYGFDLPEPKERVTHFIEAIQVIRRLLDEERANFTGPNYTLTDAPFAPKAVQSPLPLLVGTSGARMMKTTAKYANEWNTWGDPAAVRGVTEKFFTACDSVGTDPATIRRSAQAMVFFADTEAGRQKLIERVPAGRSIVGNGSQIAEIVAEYAADGVDEFALTEFTMGASAEQRRESIERFHEEVANQFR